MFIRNLSKEQTKQKRYAFNPYNRVRDTKDEGTRNIAEYFTRVQMLLNRMKRNGERLDNKTRIQKTLRSLTPKFDDNVQFDDYFIIQFFSISCHLVYYHLHSCKVICYCFSCLHLQYLELGSYRFKTHLFCFVYFLERFL